LLRRGGFGVMPFSIPLGLISGRGKVAAVGHGLNHASLHQSVVNEFHGKCDVVSVLPLVL
jgi:hypothetical protein